MHFNLISVYCTMNGRRLSLKFCMVNYLVCISHEMSTIASNRDVEGGKMDTIKSKLAERMKLLIDSQTDKRGKFAQLETLTGIPAEGWKSFYYARQRPNPDMIEALAQAWPEFAFWLVTGIDDFFNGHTSPPTPDGVKSPFRERDAAKALFRKKIEHARWQQKGAPDAEIDGDLYHSAEIEQQFVADIDDLASLRRSQEEDLLSIEEKRKLKRIDSPN